VTTIEPGRNLGFADGCNLAATIVWKGRRVFATLNNDAEVEPDAIAKLIKGIEVSPDVCAVTGKIRYAETKRTGYWYAGARFSRSTGRPFHCSSDNEKFAHLDSDGLVASVRLSVDVVCLHAAH